MGFQECAMAPGACPQVPGATRRYSKNFRLIVIVVVIEDVERPRRLLLIRQLRLEHQRHKSREEIYEKQWPHARPPFRKYATCTLIVWNGALPRFHLFRCFFMIRPNRSSTISGMDFSTIPEILTNVLLFDISFFSLAMVGSQSRQRTPEHTPEYKRNASD
jgi:hypothetical protein